MVEVAHVARDNVDFYYWTGKKLVRSKANAKRYASQPKAHADARTIMKNKPVAYKFARIVPA